MTNEISESLIYPYLPELRAQIDVELQKGLLKKDSDVTGLNFFRKQQDIETFFELGDKEKNYFPPKDSQATVELRMRLGSKAHFYSSSTYMITNWLIDIGGISKAMYFAGMIISHFVALRAYKNALIGASFMVQRNKPEIKRKKKKGQFPDNPLGLIASSVLNSSDESDTKER